MIKSKKCSIENCNNPIFAQKLCKQHQSLRKDGKIPKSITKQTKRGKEKKESKKALFIPDLKFYLTIWNKRPHYCENCKKYLGEEPKNIYFDHILEKGNPKYEHLRHAELNISLLCWECHDSKANIPKLVELKEKLKKIYG